MTPAAPVDAPRDPEIAALVDDLIETMFAAPGIGLAAPQVAIGKRVVVYYLPEKRDEAGAGRPLTVLINPEITVLADAETEGIEACLSLPGMQGSVPRPAKVHVAATGLDGKPFDYEAEGFHARVVLHECDHLDGVLYPMRMTDLSSFGYISEMTDQPD